MINSDFDFSKIKLFVGLGNPGKNFHNTRHNVGFMFLESFTKANSQLGDFSLTKSFKAEIIKTTNANNTLILAKPDTFMNLSGESVQLIFQYYKIQPEEILVAYDDLDISLGNFKIQIAKSPKMHNGINSIEKHLNTENFWRLRIGVDNRTAELRKNISGADYVLSRFSSEEKVTLNDTFAKIISVIKIL